MKLSIALLASLGGVGAFVPSRTSSVARPHHPPADASSGGIGTTTSLNQFGTLGFDTNNLYSREEVETMRTQNEIIGFLEETQRPNTALRSDLGTTVLISGFDPTDPSSTEILDFLNSEDSPHFPFSRIIAHCEDVKVARKRLIGRNARYTGLLDKLTFSEGASSPIPSAEQLAGVSSWVAHVGGGDIARVADVADAAEGAESVKNVAILVSGATGVGGDALRGIEEMLKSKATTFAYTLLVVPEWNDEPEALCAFGIVNATDVGGSPFVTGETFSREESLRIITECLALDRAAGKCVVANAAKDANSLENMLIHGMREIGFSRIQEIEYMVTMGAKGYSDAIAAEKTDTAWEKVPDETEEEKAAKARTKEEQILLNRQKRKEAEKQEELKAMAMEWAKREYLRKHLKRHIPIKEEEFIEVIWDRAMFEADLKYRTMQGQAVSESEERKKFKENQEKKKAEAYKMEQERWKKMQIDELEPKEIKGIRLGR
ncbi:hypothetical protein ACHAW5_004431 [Stephanodiscus triporus]|uniref:Uncharacterized protein n=1 Tax=Stephanodiscus triporus TaxID=2934178 RepID=A0ABD3Q9F2_9STRA